ncbi:hypothetical protein Tco_1125309 [Tanacetum coccineum]|uniref:GAG-pre-integrase domain-containing protein n=1 Tax=Tanacetum coccineum TaxID=301880 RepID=A0ABQ5JCQ2_9ASTR
MHECEKCLKLETELLNKKDFIEKEIYDKLDNSVSNQNAPSFDQLFEINELKAQSQEKDTVIKKVKKRIKSLSGKMNEDKIKKDLKEIETINIELDHRVKLKGKALVDNDVTKHPSDLELLKIDVEPITPKLLNKKTAHSAYIKHTQEEATILRDLVEHVKSKYLLDQSIESACRPTGRTFTIVGNACPLTRITTTTEVPLRKPTALENETPKPVEPSQSWGSIVSDVPSSSLDECRVYYVEGLGHNLFSVGQFCDSNLEVAFRQHTCFIRNLEGVDLLTGSRGNNLYTLSLRDMMASSPICLLSKASKTKSWLWHRHLSHLNFGALQPFLC